MCADLVHILYLCKIVGNSRFPVQNVLIKLIHFYIFVVSLDMILTKIGFFLFFFFGKCMLLSFFHSVEICTATILEELSLKINFVIG